MIANADLWRPNCLVITPIDPKGINHMHVEGTSPVSTALGWMRIPDHWMMLSPSLLSTATLQGMCPSRDSPDFRGSHRCTLPHCRRKTRHKCNGENAGLFKTSTINLISNITFVVQPESQLRPHIQNGFHVYSRGWLAGDATGPTGPVWILAEVHFGPS